MAFDPKLSGLAAASISNPVSSAIVGINEKIGDLARRIGSLERYDSNTVAANLAAAWQTPSLVNGFMNVGGGNAPGRYCKDTFGWVSLQGRLVVPGGAADGFTTTTIFTLPLGYRPAYPHDFNVLSGGFEGAVVWASIGAEPSGSVTFTGSLAEQVSLDLVRFRTI